MQSQNGIQVGSNLVAGLLANAPNVIRRRPRGLLGGATDRTPNQSRRLRPRTTREVRPGCAQEPVAIKEAVHVPGQTLPLCGFGQQLPDDPIVTAGQQVHGV